MTEGFRRLMMYKKVDKNVLGYLRATEVTYSTEHENYHPHLHVLLFVKSSYFTLGIIQIILVKKNGQNYGLRR